VSHRRHAFGERVSPAAGLAFNIVNIGNEGGSRNSPRNRHKELSPEQSAAIDEVAAMVAEVDPTVAKDRALLCRFAETRNYNAQAVVDLLKEYMRYGSTQHQFTKQTIYSPNKPFIDQTDHYLIRQTVNSPNKPLLHRTNHLFTKQTINSPNKPLIHQTNHSFTKQTIHSPNNPAPTSLTPQTRVGLMELGS
jgi:hypothetical protein